MRIIRLVLMVVVAVLLVMPVGVAAAQSGCGCQDLAASNPQDADVVFTGTVTGQPTPENGSVLSSVQVDSVERGQVGDQVEVRTPSSPDDCGVAFGSGDRYRVFGVAVDGGADFETNTCLGTVMVVSAGQPTSGATPEASPTPTPTPGSTSAGDGQRLPDTGAPLVALAAFAVVSLSAGIVTQRFSRS